MAAHRSFLVHARNRTFEVTLRSSESGYAACVEEHLHDGKTVPLILVNRMALEIPPSDFFANRVRYRSELLSRIQEELKDGILERLNLDAPADLAKHDCYCRANLRGWPDGYPEVTEDDLSSFNF